MSDERQRPRTLILPPAPYAAAVLGGWWLDRHGHPLPWDGGVVSQPLGWLVLAAGLSLFAWTLWTFRCHRTTVNPYAGAAALCTGGPFRYSRNPIYVGDWLLMAGAALLLNTLWPWVFAPLVWFAIRYGVIRHEEAHLEAKFGDAYRAYRARVRRWG